MRLRSRCINTNYPLKHGTFHVIELTIVVHFMIPRGNVIKLRRVQGQRPGIYQDGVKLRHLKVQISDSPEGAIYYACPS